MSKNSKIKRDKNKKKSKNIMEKKPKSNINFNNKDSLITVFNNLLDPNKFTTPKTITNQIIHFCQTISDNPPIFIQVTPEPWSRQSTCEKNVDEYIKLHGGHKVFGYKIWYHPPSYIEGERHVIWTDETIFKDVTFNSDGEEQVLFVKDTLERQNSFDDNAAKVRWGADYETRKLISILDHQDRELNVRRMSNDESWERMPTYEQWKSGVRFQGFIKM